MLYRFEAVRTPFRTFKEVEMAVELNELRNMELMAKHLEQQIELWRARFERLTSIRYDKIAVQGGLPAGVEEMMDELNAVTQSLTNLLERLSRVRCEYLSRAAQLPNLYANLLNLRYVEGKSYDAISKQINYSRRQVIRLMKKAKLAFMQKIDKM